MGFQQKDLCDEDVMIRDEWYGVRFVRQAGETVRGLTSIEKKFCHTIS